MTNPQTTPYQAYTAAHELMEILIANELFKPNCETDKDVMTSIISGRLMLAFLAGRHAQ